LAAVLVAGLSGVIWLITTADGVRWLMETVSSHTDVRISAQKIEGKLAGALRLEGLDIGWPAGKIRIRTLSMQTDPRDWIAGSITVQHLIVQDVSILDNTPDAPPNLSGPGPPTDPLATRQDRTAGGYTVVVHPAGNQEHCLLRKLPPASSGKTPSGAGRTCLSSPIRFA
jgi:hypothetical protein